MSLPSATLERSGLIAALALAIAAHALLLFHGWPLVASVFILGTLLPGVLAAAWLLHRAWPTWPEFALYSLGTGYTLYVLLMLVLSILPGGLAPWQVVIAMDFLCLVLAFGWWHEWRLPLILANWQPLDITWDRWAIAGLFSVLLLGALLRFPNLGYSEFLYDEIRVLHRAAEIIQGYAPALLQHRKGPTEILVPTGFYAVQQGMTEAYARFPFAVANLAGLAAVYLLGWRMFGKVAGWSAAMLLAVDGFFVGFSRFTQYQSIIFLMTVIIVLALHRQAHSNHPHTAYLWIAGLCFVTSIYAHYEAIWVLIPGLYFLWVYGAQTGDWRGLLRASIVPMLATLVLILAFYIPFLLDSRWQSTANNIFGKRIGSNFPYNNLQDFFERATIYSSAYQILFLIVGTLIAQALILRRTWPRPAAWIAIGLTLAGLVITFFVRPDWLHVGQTDVTLIFFAMAVSVVVITPHIRHAERATWLWFGVPMLVSLFVVAEPNTHVYGFFLGWVLVVGAAIESSWGILRRGVELTSARKLALPVAAIVIAIFANYTFWFFAYTKVEILRTWRENRLWGYWTPYALPSRDSIYGFPYKNGWKVLGVLYADGTLDAPFDANETGRIADWYSRGPYICPPEAEYYVLPTKLQPNEQGEVTEKLAELDAMGYREWGYVTVNNDPRMRIFTNRPVEGAPRVFDEAEYAPIFDRTLTSPYLLKTGPALLVQPENRVDLRLGDSIKLKGYTFSQTQLAPGDKLHLELYWETNRHKDNDDKVFIQIINLNTLHKVAQRDSEPGCGKYAIDDWRADDLNYDPYTLTIATDAPPGLYTVLVGLYDRETEERYPVFAANGTLIGDFVSLSTIEIRD